jgi:hypothetical protein
MRHRCRERSEKASRALHRAYAIAFSEQESGFAAKNQAKWNF